MIFEPVEFKNKLLANRIVSAPLASSSSMEDGSPSEKSLEIYGRFAASVAGALWWVTMRSIYAVGRGPRSSLRIVTKLRKNISDIKVTEKRQCHRSTDQPLR